MIYAVTFRAHADPAWRLVEYVEADDPKAAVIAARRALGRDHSIFGLVSSDEAPDYEGLPFIPDEEA
jgi:hypothetical protein